MSGISELPGGARPHAADEIMVISDWQDVLALGDAE